MTSRQAAFRLSDLYEWQTQALAAWMNAEKKGIIEAVTGSGKTHVGIGAIAAIRAQERRLSILVVVHSIELLNQWYARLSEASPGQASSLRTDNQVVKRCCVSQCFVSGLRQELSKNRSTIPAMVKARRGETEYEIDTTGLRGRSATPLAGKPDFAPRERGAYICGIRVRTLRGSIAFGKSLGAPRRRCNNTYLSGQGLSSTQYARRGRGETSGSSIWKHAFFLRQPIVTACEHSRKQHANPTKTRVKRRTIDSVA